LNLTKDRQKKADEAVKLLRYIENVDEKVVAPMPPKMLENLKTNFSNHVVFSNLLD
jgi:hypothetical protein